MPKGKSAAQYRRESVINRILGVVFLAILIVVLYFGFEFARSTGIFENGAEVKVINSEGTSGKEKIHNTMKDVKKASDLNNRTGGL